MDKLSINDAENRFVYVVREPFNITTNKIELSIL